MPPAPKLPTLRKTFGALLSMHAILVDMHFEKGPTLNDLASS